LGSLFFILLGSRPLFVPDEGRYAEIGREMVASGDYVTPYLNHIKYFEKPILFYWLESAAIKIAGLNLWSLRSINALLGLLGCLLTYTTARQLYGRQTGWLAALILGTSILYFMMAHMISLDLTVTVFIAVGLYAFLLGTRCPLGWSRRFYFWGASVAAALAVLTKGLIGIVFPSMIIFTWIALIGEWRILKQMALPSCILIFLAITVPWHVLVEQRNPGFFHFYFIEQHFLRYTTKEVGHYQPAWFFVPYILIGFFPWIAFLPQTIVKQLPSSWKKRREHKLEIFFLLWAFLIFIFFSCSQSKLIPYILPIFPPLAILTAHYLQQAVAAHQYRGIKSGYVALLILAGTIACVFCLLTHFITVPAPMMAERYLLSSAAVLVLGTLLACFYAFRNDHKTIMITFSTSWLFLLTALAAIPYIETRTVAPLARILKPILRPQDAIIAYNQYYQDLPFYLERSISVLNWRNELSYGMQHQNRHEWMIDDNRFWQQWHSSKRVFVAMGLKEHKDFQLRYPHEKTYLLGKTTHNVLISNQLVF
jgi:4-amino-4-deoxy-L-arabinose transferase-like glycosyltransferase